MRPENRWTRYPQFIRLRTAGYWLSAPTPVRSEADSHLSEND